MESISHHMDQHFERHNAAMDQFGHGMGMEQGLHHQPTHLNAERYVSGHGDNLMAPMNAERFVSGHGNDQVTGQRLISNNGPMQVKVERAENTNGPNPYKMEKIERVSNDGSMRSVSYSYSSNGGSPQDMQAMKEIMGGFGNLLGGLMGGMGGLMGGMGGMGGGGPELHGGSDYRGGGGAFNHAWERNPNEPLEAGYGLDQSRNPFEPMFANRVTENENESGSGFSEGKSLFSKMWDVFSKKKTEDDFVERDDTRMYSYDRDLHGDHTDDFDGSSPRSGYTYDHHAPSGPSYGNRENKEVLASLDDHDGSSPRRRDIGHLLDPRNDRLL